MKLIVSVDIFQPTTFVTNSECRSKAKILVEIFFLKVRNLNLIFLLSFMRYFNFIKVNDKYFFYGPKVVKT